MFTPGLINGGQLTDVTRRSREVTYHKKRDLLVGKLRKYLLELKLESSMYVSAFSHHKGMANNAHFAIWIGFPCNDNVYMDLCVMEGRSGPGKLGLLSLERTESFASSAGVPVSFRYYFLLE